MEIVQSVHNDVIEMRLAGRLDAAWADHLSAAVSEVIRAGHHRIALDMGGVEFLTSAGIRVLIVFHKQLRGIGGRLSIVRPSQFVADVLGHMGLAALIASDEIAAVPEPSAPQSEGRQLETEQALFKLERSAPGKGLVCRVLGNPAALARGTCKASDCRSLACTSHTFSLGLGAPGESFEQCQAQVGEFLAVDGAVAFLPTGHGQTPDYLLARGTFVPRIQVLHGMECEGRLSQTISFQAAPGQLVSLGHLAEQCLAAAECDTVGMVMAVEVSGLVGAWLRQSPAGREALADPFAFPQIRDFVRFTAERAFTAEVALVVGFASRNVPATLRPSLRPLDAGGTLQGHFHAAAFTYHPLRKDAVALAEAVPELFQRQTLRGLLHLIHDTRPAEGLGQSEFVRGTCWVEPIVQIVPQNENDAQKGDLT